MGDVTLYRKQKRNADGTVRESEAYWVRFQWRGREYRRSTGRSDRREAAREGRRIRAEVEAEAPAAPAPVVERLALISLSVWDVQDTTARGAGVRQVESVEERWVPLLAYFGPDSDPAAIDYDAFQAYVVHRRGDGARGQTIRKERQALVRGWAIARRRKLLGDLPELPVIKSDPPNVDQAGKLYPLDTVLRWLDELARVPRSGKARHQAEIALRTGLRAEEVRRLCWSWVRVAADGSAVLEVPAESAKTRTARTVGLPAEALALIRELAVDAGPDLPLCPSTHLRAARVASKRVGEKSITLRDLRHTYASIAAIGGDVLAVQSALGHTDLTMTTRYMHSTQERTIAASAAVGEAISRGRDWPRSRTPQAGPPAQEAGGSDAGIPGRACGIEDRGSWIRTSDFLLPKPATAMLAEILGHPKGASELIALHRRLTGARRGRTPRSAPPQKVTA